jgi:hypothetical protein
MTKTFRKNNNNKNHTTYKGQRKYDNSSARNSLRQACQYNNGSCPYEDWDYSARFCERKSDLWNFFPQQKKKYDNVEKFPLFYHDITNQDDDDGDDDSDDGDDDSDDNNDDSDDNNDDSNTNSKGVLKHFIRPIYRLPTRRQINRTKERFYINDRINTRVEIYPYFQTFDEFMAMMVQEYNL